MKNVLKYTLLIVGVGLLVAAIVMGVMQWVCREEYRAIATKTDPPPALEKNHEYLPGKPDRWGMVGTQDRYIDWTYPPLRTNLTYYILLPGHGIAYIYFCNDGQLRWQFKEAKP